MSFHSYQLKSKWFTYKYSYGVYGTLLSLVLTVVTDQGKTRSVYMWLRCTCDSVFSKRHNVLLKFLSFFVALWRCGRKWLRINDALKLQDTQSGEMTHPIFGYVKKLWFICFTFSGMFLVTLVCRRKGTQNRVSAVILLCRLAERTGWEHENYIL